MTAEDDYESTAGGGSSLSLSDDGSLEWSPLHEIQVVRHAVMHWGTFAGLTNECCPLMGSRA